jgi:hypothetical protein
MSNIYSFSLETFKVTMMSSATQVIFFTFFSKQKMQNHINLVLLNSKSNLVGFLNYL